MYDELVKRIRSEAVYLPEKFSKNAELLDVLMKAADAIEELSKPRWIPVTERLPEAYKPVLLYNGEGIATGYMHSDKRFTVNGSYFPSRPTHWMPLPQPPKEET